MLSLIQSSFDISYIDKVFHSEGSSVSYETMKTWHYLPSESLPLDTLVTSVDLPVLATAEFARGNYWTVGCNNTLISSSPTYILDLSCLNMHRSCLQVP